MVGVALLLPAARFGLISCLESERKSRVNRNLMHSSTDYTLSLKSAFHKDVHTKQDQTDAGNVGIFKKKVCIKVARYFSMTAIVTTITVIIA